jgi:hypothetical protein
MTYDWRRNAPQEAEHQYYAWCAKAEPASPDQLSFDAVFVRGARWAVETTSALSPAVASLIEFVHWLDLHEPVSSGRSQP